MQKARFNQGLANSTEALAAQREARHKPPQPRISSGTAPQPSFQPLTKPLSKPTRPLKRRQAIAGKINTQKIPHLKINGETDGGKAWEQKCKTMGTGIVKNAQ